MTLLYKIFIRPLVEYGTTVTSPLKQGDSKAIESVQNAFTRRLYCRQKGRYLRPDDKDYKSAAQRNELYNLASLECRRKWIDKKIVSKMLADKVDINTSDFFTVTYKNRTRAKTKFTWSKCKTKLRRNFFTNRTLTRLMQK
uniref:Uncharacterized protein n=1 Tax=Caenorhabditis japonica TaxID=281687 RepID=A0A8R1E8C8_CAEJA